MHPFRIEVNSLNEDGTLEALVEETFGQVDEIGQSQSNRIKIDIFKIAAQDDSNPGLFLTTMAHEIGHSLGLTHAKDELGVSKDVDSNWSIKDPEYKDNIMRTQGEVGFKTTIKQIQEIAKLIEQQKTSNKKNNGN